MRRVTSDEGLLDDLVGEGYDFFTGVPDSALRAFISDLDRLPRDAHVTATWEAEAVALPGGGPPGGGPAGVALGGGRPCVYLQNAGLGHTVNPLASLCIPYDIDLLLVIGHRHTLPQHA